MADEKSIARTDRSPPAQSGDGESSDSNLDRLVSDTKSLTDDVAEWLRLKIQLIQIEVHERITEEVNALLSSVLVLGLLMVAILLAMMALGLVIGQFLGNVGLGFAAASVLVIIAAILLGRTQPQWIGNVMYFLVPRRWLKGIRMKDDDSRED